MTEISYSNTKRQRDERQLQMQAAATLAFAEDYALRRNGIQEGERENFFLVI